MSEQVVTAIISTLGAITVAVFAPKIKDNIAKRSNRPIDHMEVYFKGYEKLFKQLEAENEKKAKIIQLLEKQTQDQERRLELQKKELDENLHIIHTMKQELAQEREQNALLQKQLQAFMIEVGGQPTTDIN